MANVFDYLAWRGDLTLGQDSFSEVDGTILARLSYFPFEELAQFPDKPISVGDALEMLFSVPDLKKRSWRKEICALCVFCGNPRAFPPYNFLNFVIWSTRNLRRNFPL